MFFWNVFFSMLSLGLDWAHQSWRNVHHWRYEVNWIDSAHQIKRVPYETELTQVKVIIRFKLIIIVAILIHFPNILRLSFVQISKISKDTPLSNLFVENSQHSQSCFNIESITILRFYYLLSFKIVKACKFSIVDVLNIHPLDFKVSLEF